jgi:hypothetical protein
MLTLAYQPTEISIMTKCIPLATAAFLTASAASAATTTDVVGGVTTFFDSVAYDAVVTTLASESFADTTLDIGVFSSAVPSAALGGSFQIRPDRLRRVSGRPGDAAQSTTFNLATGISAISLSIANFGGGESVSFSLSNGDSFTLDGDGTGADGFFGFASTSEFSSFTVSDVTESQFRIDEISAGASDGITAAPIPLPATLPLLLGALGLVGWTARRKA